MGEESTLNGTLGQYQSNWHLVIVLVDSESKGLVVGDLVTFTLEVCLIVAR